VSPDTLEYFDPFGEKPSPRYKQEMKKILTPGLRQFKINRVQLQDISTKTCGFHAIRFLKDRARGKSFKEATFYELPKMNKSKKGENSLKPIIKEVEEFGYVKR
jgi:hypothetical protein